MLSVRLSVGERDIGSKSGLAIYLDPCMMQGSLDQSESEKNVIHHQKHTREKYCSTLYTNSVEHHTIQLYQSTVLNAGRFDRYQLSLHTSQSIPTFSFAVSISIQRRHCAGCFYIVNPFIHFKMQCSKPRQC